jgi:hypothetical protein
MISAELAAWWATLGLDLPEHAGLAATTTCTRSLPASTPARRGP